MLAKDSRPFLVVCPLSVLHDWVEEYAKCAPSVLFLLLKNRQLPLLPLIFLQYFYRAYRMVLTNFKSRERGVCVGDRGGYAGEFGVRILRFEVRSCLLKSSGRI